MKLDKELIKKEKLGFFFVLGVFFTAGSLFIMRCCYVREYEYGD